MKEILILSTLFFSLSTNAQTDATKVDTPGIKFIEPPDSTGFGTPDGKLVNKQIGAIGGTIISDDGRVTLIFPAGALSANTPISVQSTTNLAPNGVGKAYQFQPSGIQFKKPVQIIFHYIDEEAESCPPELMGLAMQDHKGKWSFFNYDDWDSTAKTLKGFIHHFSGLSNVNKLQLRPVTELLKVGRPTFIEIIDISRIFVTQSSELDFDVGTLNKKAPMLWFVNGIENGNSSVGTTRAVTYKVGKNEFSKGASFLAPGYLPKQNPAFIRTDVYVSSGKRKVYNRARSLRCKVEIYDEYKISIIQKGPSVLRCGAELEDRSSFQARLYFNKVEITDVINSGPSLTKLPNCKSESRGGRKAEYTLTYDPGVCQGPVHVSSNMLLGYGMLTNDQTKAPPDITIEFVPTIVKIMNEQTHYPPTPGGSTNKFFLKRQKIIPPGEAKDDPPEVLEDETVGNKIQFIANGKRQEYNRPGDKIEHSFQLIIEPIELF